MKEEAVSFQYEISATATLPNTPVEGEYKLEVKWEGDSLFEQISNGASPHLKVTADDECELKLSSVIESIRLVLYCAYSCWNHLLKWRHVYKYS